VATTTKEHRIIVFNKVTNGISQKHYEKYGHIQSLDWTARVDWTGLDWIGLIPMKEGTD